MAWIPSHAGEVLLATLTGQAATGLNAGSGVVQIPIDPTTIGYPVPADFVSRYMGVRVRMEFTGNASPTSTGWFAYAYLGDRAYDPGQVGHLPGNLNTPILSGVNEPFSAMVDFWFSARRFAPSPVTYATWNGYGAYDLEVLGYGDFDNSSLGNPQTKASLASSFLQVYMGQNGVATEYSVQPSAVYISTFPTADTPEIVPPPEIYPPSGSYTGSQMFGIASAPGTYIRFTTDGTDPTISSEIWSRGLNMQDGMTVKAIAVAEGDVISEVASATYSLTGNKIQAIPSYQAAVLPYLLEQYKGDNP